MRYLNHESHLMCCHGGRVEIIPNPSNQKTAKSKGSGNKLTVDQLVGKGATVTIACPQVGPGVKPCTRIFDPLVGEPRTYSVKSKTDSSSYLTDALVATTDSSPPGIVQCVEPGQSSVALRKRVSAPAEPKEATETFNDHALTVKLKLDLTTLSPSAEEREGIFYCDTPSRFLTVSVAQENGRRKQIQRKRVEIFAGQDTYTVVFPQFQDDKESWIHIAPLGQAADVFELEPDYEPAQFLLRNTKPYGADGISVEYCAPGQDSPKTFSDFLKRQDLRKKSDVLLMHQFDESEIKKIKLDRVSHLFRGSKKRKAKASENVISLRPLYPSLVRLRWLETRIRGLLQTAAKEVSTQTSSPRYVLAQYCQAMEQGAHGSRIEFSRRISLSNSVSCESGERYEKYFGIELNGKQHQRGSYYTWDRIDYPTLYQHDLFLDFVAKHLRDSVQPLAEFIIDNSFKDDDETALEYGKFVSRSYSMLQSLKSPSDVFGETTNWDDDVFIRATKGNAAFQTVSATSLLLAELGVWLDRNQNHWTGNNRYRVTSTDFGKARAAADDILKAVHETLLGTCQASVLSPSDAVTRQTDAVESYINSTAIEEIQSGDAKLKNFLDVLIASAFKGKTWSGLIGTINTARRGAMSTSSVSFLSPSESRRLYYQFRTLKILGWRNIPIRTQRGIGKEFEEINTLPRYRSTMLRQFSYALSGLIVAQAMSTIRSEDATRWDKIKAYVDLTEVLAEFSEVLLHRQAARSSVKRLRHLLSKMLLRAIRRQLTSQGLKGVGKILTLRGVFAAGDLVNAAVVLHDGNTERGSALFFAGVFGAGMIVASGPVTAVCFVVSFGFGLLAEYLRKSEFEQDVEGVLRRCEFSEDGIRSVERSMGMEFKLSMNLNDYGARYMAAKGCPTECSTSNGDLLSTEEVLNSVHRIHMQQEVSVGHIRVPTHWQYERADDVQKQEERSPVLRLDARKWLRGRKILTTMYCSDALSIAWSQFGFGHADLIEIKGLEDLGFESICCRFEISSSPNKIVTKATILTKPRDGASLELEYGDLKSMVEDSRSREMFTSRLDRRSKQATVRPVFIKFDKSEYTLEHSGDKMELVLVLPCIRRSVGEIFASSEDAARRSRSPILYRDGGGYYWRYIYWQGRPPVEGFRFRNYEGMGVNIGRIWSGVSPKKQVTLEAKCIEETQVSKGDLGHSRHLIGDAPTFSEEPWVQLVPKRGKKIRVSSPGIAELVVENAEQLLGLKTDSFFQLMGAPLQTPRDDWSSMFVFYCFQKAASQLQVPLQLSVTSSAIELFEQIRKRRNRVTKYVPSSPPRPGDIVGFSGGNGHIGIVESSEVSSGQMVVHTIEGCIGGDPAVRRMRIDSRTWSLRRSLGFVTYEIED